MAFSMHSHSGQFCPGHAKDSLEEIIQTAIARGMQTFALTEHMPRNSEADLYPEEIAANVTIDPTHSNHHAYITEAVRLREKYASHIQLFIGFEGEWIRPSYGPLINTLASDPNVDFFIGSVHHVHGIPIDYNAEFYAQAVAASTGDGIGAGTELGLFRDYYDAQYEMLQALKPKVVGHFDLIRLFSSERNAKIFCGASEKAERNLRLIVKQGGLLEINSAGLRKGLQDPYPGRILALMFKSLGGKFTLSDDSHGIEQVGTNYGRALKYLEDLDVKEVWTFEKRGRFLELKSVPLDDIKATFRDIPTEDIKLKDDAAPPAPIPSITTSTPDEPEPTPSAKALGKRPAPNTPLDRTPEPE